VLPTTPAIFCCTLLTLKKRKFTVIGMDGDQELLERVIGRTLD